MRFERDGLISAVELIIRRRQIVIECCLGLSIWRFVNRCYRVESDLKKEPGIKKKADVVVASSKRRLPTVILGLPGSD